MERNARFELTVHSFLPTMETGSGHETHLCIPLRPVMSMVLRDIPKLIDEPTSGLDGYHMRLTVRFFKQLAKEGKCVLLITHDMDLIAEAADCVLYLEQGKVRYHRNVLRKV